MVGNNYNYGTRPTLKEVLCILRIQDGMQEMQTSSGQYEVSFHFQLPMCSTKYFLILLVILSCDSLL